MNDERPLPELLRRIEAALATMDDLPRAVFERHCFRDLDYLQVAHALDIGIDAVERHLADAILHLLRCTDGGGGP
ncbi:RNA polymerase sigma factor [Sphingomonas sp. MMS12-HWE2-04]|uniref:RNA polymerase sigma factor n=1 Tax=Sphingomonas sp. MMS12-HWE2-04 TaxID=3234199 RepID=UPI00384B1F6D